MVKLLHFLTLRYLLHVMHEANIRRHAIQQLLLVPGTMQHHPFVNDSSVCHSLLSIGYFLNWQ